MYIDQVLLRQPLHPLFMFHPARFQGNYEQAWLLYERSLAIREKALGPEHPDVAKALNNMANLLQKQVRTFSNFYIVYV